MTFSILIPAIIPRLCLGLIWGSRDDTRLILKRSCINLYVMTSFTILIVSHQLTLSDCSLTSNEQFSAISWWEKVTYRWDDDVRFVLDQHSKMDFCKVRVLAYSAVDRGFGPLSGQTKDYKISMCCFSLKQAPLKSKNKDWLARNQDHVSEWSDMSTRGLLCQWVSTLKIQLSVLV